MENADKNPESYDDDVEDDFTAQPAVSRKPFRDVSDWMLVAAFLSMAAMLWLHAQDLWFRTDLRFFPLLPLTTIFLILRNAQLGPCDSRLRGKCSLGISVVAAALAVTSSLIFSAWMACLALSLATVAWMLRRFGRLPWYGVVEWTLPIWVLLLFPISDASDLTGMLENAVASSSSAVLDVVGVPQIASNNVLEFRQAKLSTARICRGVGSPYLLLSCVLLLTMLHRRSFSIGLVSALTVPLWAWIAAVMHVTAGLYLWEVYERNLFSGYRNLLMQLVMLTITMLSIWLFQSALASLLAPFRAYSQSVGWVHKLFNQIALWPAKDPLRKKRTELEEADQASTEDFSQLRYVQFTLAAATIAFVSGGTLSGHAIIYKHSSQRIEPFWVNPESMDSQFAAESLPLDFGGMRQVAFEVLHNQDAYFSGANSANWIYTAELRRIRLSVELPGRGFYPVEQNYLSPLRRFANPRESSTIEVEGLGTVLLDEIVLLDELFGRSYVCYATLTLNGSAPFRTAITENHFSWEGVSKSLSLQPTIANVQLFVESAGVLTDEQRANYRDTLAQACELLKDSLLALRSGEPTGLPTDSTP